MSEKKRLELLEKAKNLPETSGCYLFKKNAEHILYVGKAKNLKSRVTSYFQAGAKTPKTEILVGHIQDFDFILTGSDAEAFVLENNLIKKHSPKYNIRLKDDKTYPYLLVDANEPFPRLSYVRRPVRKKNVQVFGPFVLGSNLSEVLSLLTKLFQLRDCTLREFHSRIEPCLLYQMQQCSGPCVELISAEKYAENLELALAFFKGKGRKGLAELKARMQQASLEEKFELAAQLRDAIVKLEQFVDSTTQKNAELGQQKNLDIFAFHLGEVEVDVSLYLVREGILLGHKNFHFLSVEIDQVENDYLSFIHQYYTKTAESLPQEILFDFVCEDLKAFNEGLNLSLNLKGDNKIIINQHLVKYKDLIQLTKANAFEVQRMRLSQQESVYVGLMKLKELLSLKERPQVIECYDIALWQGKSPTASKVTFHEGKPDKKNYRHYHLSELPEGNNDFAMMEEVLKRRLEHQDLPDLFLVDGGVAQVNVFERVLEFYQLKIPVVGIAKARTLKGAQFSKEISKSDERLIIPGRANPYILSQCMPLFRLCVQMRDEAHRFSRGLHHKAEKKRVLYSWLDDVPGVGEVIKKRILKNWSGDRAELKQWSAKEIAVKFEIPESLATNLLSYKNKNE